MFGSLLLEGDGGWREGAPGVQLQAGLGLGGAEEVATLRVRVHR